MGEGELFNTKLDTAGSHGSLRHPGEEPAGRGWESELSGPWLAVTCGS